ncbi:MAG: HAMP domain-containing histidine kinase [Deltaproteobacteria bacterium]|jgi:signal transduction histidine kinase|nr:HAMP domain-containing histidine kinase [Deltaproteobacteria bacterium]
MDAEMRAVERSVFGKRWGLWIGVLAVLLPLAILLALQYWWLTDLEHNSAIARKATLENYLKTIAKEVDYFYTKVSERALNLPAYLFTEHKIEKAGHFFKKKEVPGVKQLFIVSFVTKEEDDIFFYNPDDHSMGMPDWSDESLAVWAAASPWKIYRKTGAKVDTTVLAVDQHDSWNRLILNPITDENSKLVGLAGLIVDQKFFEKKVLPKAIETALPEVDPKDGLVVCVRDGRGRQVLPEGGYASPKDDQVSRHFSFIFTDWTVSLQGKFAKPEKWARTNFALNMTLSMLLAAALVTGIVFTLRTALREMRLSAMKNEFVSNVSHELRTPLSSIRVFGEFMRRGRVTEQEKVREYGGYIETESRRLTQLINNILDFSRIESGRKVYTFEFADLEEVLTGTLATFGVRLRDSGFTVDFHGPEEPLPEIEIDANAIDRAIANLLDNAVKYSDGGKDIVVELAEKNGEVLISVTDHGIGIPRDEQKRIFERFHRVSTGLVHDVKGSGLGLSLVRHIAEAHGGRVSVSSEVGKGSTFTIHLPIERDA